jgi:beta-glucosidase/6-phospho-beta-glucosidase/beta-galactosidase
MEARRTEAATQEGPGEEAAPKENAPEYMTGFESTQIFGAGTDVLETTDHINRYEADLELVRRDGIKTLRYPIPWHRVEHAKGKREWGFVDDALACLREKGLTPIADPLHHTSFPEWLDEGFANAQFPQRYTEFVAAFAQRYPWVRQYTLFNEPFATTMFCTDAEIWYPRKKGAFFPMGLNVARAQCMAGRALDAILGDPVFVRVDLCERHTALDEESGKQVEFRNHLRFLLDDLVLGQAGSTHPLYAHLLRQGARAEEIEWFRRNATHIDIMGLDYYPYVEAQWYKNKQVLPPYEAHGFSEIAMDYAKRFGIDIMLSETNTRGHVSDRITWLKLMAEESELLAQRLPQGVRFRGFCWFPYIDSTDWDSRCTAHNRNIDPVGIYWLDEKLERNESELSRTYSRLAKGAITSKEIPAYRLLPPTDTELKHHYLLMQHWNWRAP